MAYSILLTSLYDTGKNPKIGYYGTREDGRRYFCDAMMNVEASAKCILSRYHIDEIITIGRRLTFDEGDDGKILTLREGSSFYTSDINELSTYSLFRYRLAQYIEELKIDLQDVAEVLSPEEQDEVKAFLHEYFKKGGDDGIRRFNKFFSELAVDQDLYGPIWDEMAEAIPGSGPEMDRFMAWSKYYLYSQMRDSYKFELLSGNENVKVRFIPTSIKEGGKFPVDNILQIVSEIVEGHEEPVHLYVALNNDDQTDNFVLLNILDIVDVMQGDDVEIKRIYTTSGRYRRLAGNINNDTQGYRITELVASAKAFLQYGQVDMIVEYWEKCRTKNENVDKLIYAMRHIDYGISLCQITEVINGINQLKELFSRDIEFTDDDYYSKLFAILAEGIRRDYGPLLEGDEVDPIELIRWAFRKRFYQQTLTFIEAKASDLFVDRGIFYYCNDKSDRERNVQIFGELRSHMRAFEAWTMDNVSHFFIKSYNRANQRGNKGADPSRAYAAFRIKDLDNTDPDMITAYSLCEDREALEDLLFAYYHIGRIRNLTNHAEEHDDGEGTLVPDEKDIPTRMAAIRDSIQYFLNCYDNVNYLIKDKEANVVKVSSYEVKGVARRLEEERRSGNRDDNMDDRDNRDNSRDDNRDNNRNDNRNNNRNNNRENRDREN